MPPIRDRTSHIDRYAPLKPRSILLKVASICAVSYGCLTLGAHDGSLAAPESFKNNPGAVERLYKKRVLLRFAEKMAPFPITMLADLSTFSGRRM